MSISTIREGDTLKITVNVTNKDGSVKDMTGATIQAEASATDETDVPATTAAFTTIASGIAEVFFGAGILVAGSWTVETEFTLSGEVQTFSKDVTVLASSLA